MELVDYASDSSGEEGVERNEKEGVQVEQVLPRAEEAIAGTLGGEKRKQGFRNSPDVVAKATKTKQESYAKTTASNVMLPPQVRGKKNVVTEDLEKMGLKVKRRQKN